MPHHGSEVDTALAAIVAGARAAEFETITLDFKEEKSSGRDTERMIVEAMVCFANSRGGTLVVGVRDKASGIDALVGVRQMTPKQIELRVHELTQPRLSVEAATHPSYPQLILVSVPKGLDIYSDSQGRAYRRIDTECHPMSPQETTMLYEERKGRDYSAESTGRSIDDASSLAVDLARRMLAVFTDHRSSLARASVRDLLAAVGALAGRDEFNRAGELLFCDPLPGARERVQLVYQYKATPGGEPQHVDRSSQPLLLAFARTLDAIQARATSQRITLPNGQQIAIEDFPLVAVRETLSNAVCHRDLSLNEPVTVEHSPTVMRVTSPGPLLPGITPKNIITTPSRARNPALLRIVRNLGLAEELGSGVDRMMRAMVGAGRSLPEIDGQSTWVRVSLVGGASNTQLARFVAQLPQAERDDTDTMLLLAYLCGHKTVTAAIAAPHLQKTEPEALGVLRRLAAEDLGLLEQTRATAGRSSPGYRLRNSVLQQLGSAVAYNRRTLDDTDRKVILHLREYSKITNNTIKNLFDVDVYRARDILGSLAERGIIVRISAATRGPTVEWGPGPKFPAARKKASAVDRPSPREDE